MINAPVPNPADERIFKIALALVIGVRIAVAIFAGMSAVDNLSLSDNDDIMRFLSVQDWMNGQDWYDIRQYRMLPPEGLDLHWSRYVDLGIAVLIWPLTWVLPMEQAMSIGIVLWPAFLFILLTLLTGYSARKMFGPLVGATSMMGLMLWTVTGSSYFAGVRLDHHNVQILLMTAMTFSVVLPGSAILRGILGGLAAALSLAVGLEALLVIALFGGVLVVRSLLVCEQAIAQLVAFSTAVALCGGVLFIGQTPTSEWVLNHCDELSVPYLSIATTGAGISIAYAFLAAKLGRLYLRVIVFTTMCGLGVFFLFPLIEPCFAGPYGDLPQDVIDIIRYRVTEGHSALQVILEGRPSAYSFAIPTLAITILATLMWAHRCVTRHDDKATTDRLGILLLFAWLGVIASMSQIRLTLLAASAIPTLIGFALAAFLRARRDGDSIFALVLVVPLLVVIISPSLTLLDATQEQSELAISPSSGGVKKVEIDSCRTPEALRNLVAIPRGTILASANISAPILLLSPHSVVTGPYHRSPDAFRDGVLPFEKDEDALLDAARRTNSDYLLLCRNAVYGSKDSFGTQLAMGATSERLAEIKGINDKLLVFKVLRD